MRAYSQIDGRHADVHIGHPVPDAAQFLHQHRELLDQLPLLPRHRARVVDDEQKVHLVQFGLGECGRGHASHAVVVPAHHPYRLFETPGRPPEKEHRKGAYRDHPFRQLRSLPAIVM
jgi:hypothetical protein